MEQIFNVYRKESLSSVKWDLLPIYDDNFKEVDLENYYYEDPFIESAGLELMAIYQEVAYERLCWWVEAECRKLGNVDNPEVSELLKTAVRCLKERSVLFKYSREEAANMRHNALFRRFTSALTRGGLGGMPRSIVVHTNQLYKNMENGKIESDLTSVLDRIFEGDCWPFKMRVEQVLQSQPSFIVAYKLSNILEFYSYIMSDLLGRDTSLCNTIWMLEEASQKTFSDILKSHDERLLCKKKSSRTQGRILFNQEGMMRGDF